MIMTLISILQINTPLLILMENHLVNIYIREEKVITLLHVNEKLFIAYKNA